ncbi:MAG: efflux RND transporter periplasmic adaptor subunit [Pseudomonadota bacterium]
MGEQAKTEKRSGTARRLLRAVLMGTTALAFLGLMAGGTAVLHMRANAEIPPQANPPVTVRADKLEFADSYTIEERFAGRLEPARETRLAFERSGLVREILFDEGDPVQEGQVVARLDTAKLEADRRTLKAQRKELEAQRGLAEVTVKRQQKLAKKRWASEQTYDEARFRLMEVEAGLVRIDARIAALEVDITKSVLRAPFSGVIANRALDEGSVVSPGAVVADLLESGERQVRIGVSAAAAPSLNSGETHAFEIGGERYSGKVLIKRPDLEASTRTVPVRFAIESAEKIPFGEIVELVVERQVEAAGVWLPLTALTEGRKGLWSVLTVVDAEGGLQVSREAAEILHVSGRRAYVRGTFQPGARLLLGGTNRVTPGQTVLLAKVE